MIAKHGGRGRVGSLLAKNGYGKSGATKTADGGGQHLHDNIAKHLREVEQEVNTEVGKHRMDRKGRASGGKSGEKWMQNLNIKKGAMTKAAKREGVSNAKYEQEHKNDSGKSGKRARLALVFKKSKH